jgi:5'-deoxynucleotidase YfbR-like HD superfamily hydrolase
MEKTQKEREEEAIKKMDSEFWKVIPNLISLIKEYENIESEEAKFIRSLDWIAPIIQIVMEWWQSWIDWKLTAEKVKWRAYWKCLNKKLEKILDIYFEKAEKGNMFYIEIN